MDYSIKKSPERYEIEEQCPICGCHLFSTAPFLKNREQFYSATVLWCTHNSGTANRCKGRVCYCKKCEKWYPESNFGYHNNAYECKECGQVQWDLNDIKAAETRGKAILNSVNRNMGW